MYIMLCGCPPFKGRSEEEIYASIKRGHVKFHEKEWNYISTGAKSLVLDLLTFEPKERMTASEALKHRWLEKNAPDKPLDPKILENLKSFQTKSQLKTAIMTFMVNQLVQVGEMKELQETFRAFDIDNDGSLTEEELVQGYQQTFNYSMQEAIQEVRSILNIIDFNKTNKVDYTEFVVAATDHKKLLSKNRILNAFIMFDLVNNFKPPFFNFFKPF